MERSAQDTSNALLKTSGTPYDWGPGSSKICGLAKYDSSNKLPWYVYQRTLSHHLQMFKYVR